MIHLPNPDGYTNLQRLIPILSEMLGYVAMEAVKSGLTGSLQYDCDSDILVYHYKPNSIDLEMFDMLRGTDEIWVITKAGGDRN